LAVFGAVRAGQQDDFGVSHVLQEIFGLFDGLILRSCCSGGDFDAMSAQGGEITSKTTKSPPKQAARAHPCRISFFELLCAGLPRT
jgi:hypothetical protein